MQIVVIDYEDGEVYVEDIEQYLAKSQETNLDTAVQDYYDGDERPRALNVASCSEPLYGDNIKLNGLSLISLLP